MERGLGIFRKPLQKDLKESIDVFPGHGRGGDSCAVISVGVPNIDGLV